MTEEERQAKAANAIAQCDTVYAELECTLDDERLTLSQQINTLSEMRKTIELRANLDGTLRLAGADGQEGGH
jgi:hypothetical protein